MTSLQVPAADKVTMTFQLAPINIFQSKSNWLVQKSR